MHPAIEKLQNGERIPIQNIVCRSGGGSSRWVEAYRQFARWGGQSVALHKQMLSRQDCTFTGTEYRSWVWERPEWTVLVGPRLGVEFDVPAKTSFQGAWALWKNYCQVLGFAAVKLNQ